jgi:transposase
MIGLFSLFLALVASSFKSKSRLKAENAVLRHQLIVLRRKMQGRVRLTNNDRWFLVQLYRWFPSILAESSDEKLPSNARFACQTIVAQLSAVQTQISGLDKRIIQAHRANADSKRLEAIPGFGVILSTAVDLHRMFLRFVEVLAVLDEFGAETAHRRILLGRITVRHDDHNRQSGALSGES